MVEIQNTALSRLKSVELALGIGLRQARSVDVGRIMKSCGYDWIFIDMEHGSMWLIRQHKLASQQQMLG